MKPYALTITHLTVVYQKFLALWNVSAQIPDGTLVAVIGPNGAGKTTLIKSILGLVKPVAGTIQLFGSSKQHKTDAIAYLPQRSTIDWDFPVTAFDVVLMGSYARLGWFKRAGTLEKKQALDALTRVGLYHHKDTPIKELSGGQQQRVFLARALCQNAQLYLMDEPFIGIDVTTEKTIAEILKTLRSAGKTIVVVHHDLQTLKEYFDWVLMINVKAIACGPIDKVLTRDFLHATYSSERFKPKTI